MSARWKKVLADLWSNKARTFLVVLSIAVGIFAVGSIESTSMIMQYELPSDYAATQPHSASIYCWSFDDDVLVALSKLPGVAAVEGRSSVTAQMKDRDGRTRQMSIQSIPPLQKMKIDLIHLEQGSSELRDKQIYIERQGARDHGIKPGDRIQVIIGEDKVRELEVAGIVQDLQGNPYFLSGQPSGFVNPATLEWLGGSREYTEMLVRVSENEKDEVHVTKIANLVADKIKKGGREVFATIVYHPGQHPVQQIFDAMMVLLSALGLLVVFLSGFLVVNTITALMGQQIRQIGVMKAVGATMAQVTGMYLALILSFGLLALAIAIPAGAAVANFFCGWLSGMFNLNLDGFSIPLPSLIMQIAVGIGVPLIGAFIPVMNGARLTVREAISNYGLGSGGKRTWLDTLIDRLAIIPRPLLISMRNTFRRKARLALTLSTLTLAGAIFMGVLNVRDSMYMAIDRTLGYVLSDVNVDFTRSYRSERVEAALKGVPGVVKAEGWGFATAQAMKPDGVTSDQVVLYAQPNESKLIKPHMTAGRWLLPEDEAAVIVGNHFMKLRPDVKVGDVITFRVDDTDFPFTVVGIYEIAGNVIPPIIYTNYEYLAKIRNDVDQVYSLRIVTDRSDEARQKEVVAALEVRFKELGMDAFLQTGTEIQQQNYSLINILISLLLSMAVLIAVVGGLGLMGTMSMNVLERTREIGVMRSIGAVNPSIFQIVVVEGMVIGLISWALGALLSIPITQLLDNVVGVSMFNVPLQFVFSMTGFIGWVVIVIVLSAVASMLPARNAVRLTIRDVLAYE